jgi:hypothetical protein
MIETAWRHGKSESKITRLLPPEGEDFQYKIKSAAEPHERVAKESQLDRA